MVVYSRKKERLRVRGIKISDRMILFLVLAQRWRSKEKMVAEDKSECRGGGESGKKS